MPGRCATEPKDYTFTGQRSYMDDPTTTAATEGFGLMFYNARWYDPYLKQFSSPDSLIPDPYNSLDYNRYTYARSNPIRYNDPSGHMVACDNDDWACQHHWDEPITYDDSEHEIDNVVNRVKSRIPRPISGVHGGLTGSADIAVGEYGYSQTDYIFDWLSGTVYMMETTGGGLYVGTPNIVGVEFYAGGSSYYGIPMSASPEDVADWLAGENFDLAASGSVDVGPASIGTGSGVSFDIDPNTGGWQTTSAGPMFTLERNLSFGGGIFPTSLDGNLERGKSYSTVNIIYQIPWWPKW